MYFKIVNGTIQNSRKPIVGGFEQNGLVYERDPARLVVVSNTEVRDKTDQEIFDGIRPSIESALFAAAEGHIQTQLSAMAYAKTLVEAEKSKTKAQENAAWVQGIWDDHDARIAALAPGVEVNYDFSSHGSKPNKVKDY